MNNPEIKELRNTIAQKWDKTKNIKSVFEDFAKLVEWISLYVKVTENAIKFKNFSLFLHNVLWIEKKDQLKYYSETYDGYCISPYYITLKDFQQIEFRVCTKDFRKYVAQFFYRGLDKSIYETEV